MPHRTGQYRSARELVSQANDLSREFFAILGYEVPVGFRFDRATNARQRMAWDLAVAAYEHIEATDLANALDDLDGD